MQKVKYYYLKLKNKFEIANNYLNNNWLIIFLAVTFLFFFKLIIHVVDYFKNQEYANIHNEIFLMSLLCFISVYFVRAAVLWFLIPFLVVRMIDFHSFFDSFQNYFFYKSIFSSLFENLASKDINVIIVLFLTIYFIGIFLFLIFYLIIKKVWHLKSIFLIITIFVYLITTLMFHYFLIEKNYRHIINNEISHMEKVANANEKDFKIICENQEYVCATSKEEIKKFVNNKDFNSFIDNIPDHYMVKGNFPFGNSKNVYLIIKTKEKWVINPVLAKKSFREAENYFMICLDIAHTFWLFFFIWLNIFHFRKKHKIIN